jgi:hypothetical protein
MPSGSQRYLVGNWFAAGTSIVATLVGTVLLLSVRHQLPARVVLHWNDGEPDIRVSLSVVLMLTALLSIGLSTLILVLGRVAAGSWRHTWSSGALSAALAPALLLCGTTWAQRNGPVVAPPPAWMYIGPTYAFIAGNLLKSWLRPKSGSSTTRDAVGEPVPQQVRRAWVGQARMPWSARIGSSLGVAVLTVLYAWLTDVWALSLCMGGVAVAIMVYLGRAREVAADYSGVGVRGGSGLPTPIQMAEIRAVSVRSVSALREFGGWGHRMAVDGTEGWITRSGEALVIHRWDKPDFVFTVDDASEAATLLNTFLTHSEVA